MERAILLSLAASLCTATSSVCQRLGARHVEQCGEMHGFDPWLVFRLAREPLWLIGLVSMIAGFGFQVGALHFGPLALVQPILAVELLFVFGYLALRSRATRRARWREWGAAVVMSAGISVFLRAAAPTGGQEHASAALWWLAGAGTAAAAAIAITASRGGSPLRRAACLGIATGVTWGFVAAVIKELSSHVSAGPAAVFTNWSAYVLLGVGALAMLLTSHAMAAGPLAASQPGFTIGDPVTAILLGTFVFSEHLATSPAALTGEVAGLIAVALGVWTLSGSALITDSTQPQRKRAGETRSRELTRRSR